MKGFDKDSDLNFYHDENGSHEKYNENDFSPDIYNSSKK